MLAQNTRWYEVQNGFFAVYNERMSGVMAPLKAYHCLCVVGEPVNYLAFSLVPPLRTNHHNIF